MDCSPAISLLVLHRQPLTALGVRSILSDLEGFRLVKDQAELATVQPHSACLVVADYESAMEWLAADPLQEEGTPGGRAPVLILSGSDGEREVRHALCAGAMGYLLQDCLAAELVAAARAVALNVRHVAAAAARKLAESLTYAALTARESSVLQLLGAGHCNKTIAAELDISVATVKTHVSAIFEKLGVTSRAQAISRANERGLIAPRTAPGKHSQAVVYQFAANPRVESLAA